MTILPRSGHALVLSTVGVNHRFRKSTLTSWNVGDDEEKRYIVLGTCTEETTTTKGVDDENNENDAIVRFTIEVPHAHHKNSDVDENHAASTTANTILSVDLPDQRGDNGSNSGGGSLASQLWPASLASMILLASPEFRGFVVDDDKRRKTIVELGSGVGLAGLMAGRVGGDCVLTDNDHEAIEMLQKVITLNKERLPGTMKACCMDWRDNDINNEMLKDNGVEIPVDIVLGSDIAYYWYLLRPIMDTAMNLMGRKGETSNSQSMMARNSVFVVVGQANRESQWDLYRNVRDGCYNQVIDEREPPWDGRTQMLLYKLQMSQFCEKLEDCDTIIDGVIPIAVLMHQQDAVRAKDQQQLDPPFQSHAYVATDEDDRNILKSF
jgi:Lysine methyltransferase